MSCILITGGAGFIGSNLADYLMNKGFKIVVLDNLSSGNLKNVNPSINFINGDITNPADVKKAIKNVNIVCHLAAQASVAVSMKKQIFDAHTNVIGTINLLKHSLSNKIDQFIFSSTGGAIYGEPRSLPVLETHPEQPISIYGVSKLAAEKYIEFYSKLGLNTSILRLANVYGPRQDPNGEAGVISIFLGNILNKSPLFVFGDGTSSRDYVYVKDVAKAIFKIIEKPISTPVNISLGKEIFLNELIKVILQVTNSSSEVLYKNERDSDVKNIYLDTQKLQSHLTWKPDIKIEEGIRYVWNWINKSS